MKNQVTKQAYELMQKKLAELKARRGKISKTIGEAREHGDLRENSAYHAAKDEQGLNEMRIRELEEKLVDAEVLDEKDMPAKDHVAMGATFRIKDIDRGTEDEFTLVSEVEADVLENKISTASPLGAAALNCKVGDVVEVEAPRGVIKYKILEIK